MLVFVVLALATWRISSLLVNEDGPWYAFARLRALAGVRLNDEFQQVAPTVLAGVFACVWCMSVWVGVGWAVAWELWPGPTTWVAMPLAMSAVAIAIDKVVG